MLVTFNHLNQYDTEIRGAAEHVGRMVAAVGILKDTVIVNERLGHNCRPSSRYLGELATKIQETSVDEGDKITRVVLDKDEVDNTQFSLEVAGMRAADSATLLSGNDKVVDVRDQFASEALVYQELAESLEPAKRPTAS